MQLIKGTKLIVTFGPDWQYGIAKLYEVQRDVDIILETRKIMDNLSADKRAHGEAYADCFEEDTIIASLISAGILKPVPSHVLWIPSLSEERIVCYDNGVSE